MTVRNFNNCSEWLTWFLDSKTPDKVIFILLELDLRAQFCMIGCFIDSGLDHDIFLNSDISQGSVVTQLRCCEIISQGFVANLPVNLPVKEV